MVYSWRAQQTVLPLSRFLRDRRLIVSGALGSAIAASWGYLWLGGGQIMAMSPEWSASHAALIFVMWVVMMAAMMLPGAAPTVLLVTTLASDRTANSKLVPATAMLFASGYLLVWWGFSLAATLLQWGLDEAGLLSETMAFGAARIKMLSRSGEHFISSKLGPMVTNQGELP